MGDWNRNRGDWPIMPVVSKKALKQCLVTSKLDIATRIIVIYNKICKLITDVRGLKKRDFTCRYQALICIYCRRSNVLTPPN